MKRMINNQKGFTLVEIMMVVIIIGILAVLAIPRYQKYLIESKLSEVSVSAGEIKQGMEKYYNVHNRKYPALTAVEGNASLEAKLRIELGANDNFRYGVTPIISASVYEGYKLIAYLTDSGVEHFGGDAEEDDQVIYYFPAALNPSVDDDEWENLRKDAFYKKINEINRQAILTSSKSTGYSEWQSARFYSPSPEYL